MKKALYLIIILVFCYFINFPPNVNALWYGDEQYWTCFPAGTKILMADKTQKNIEDIKIGDKVMGYDGEKMIAETVLELDAPIRDHLYILKFKDGTVLRLTSEHPLYTSEGWKAIDPDKTKDDMPNFIVGKLEIGDSVFNTKGNYTKIISMEYKPGKIQTYNLKEVSRNNNFYADSYLAHNKKSPDAEAAGCETANCTGEEDDTGGGAVAPTSTPTPTPTPIPNTTISPTITVGCGCVNNICTSECTFIKYDDVTYSDPIKCSFNSAQYSSIPSDVNKSQWCQSTLKTTGDSNGDGDVNTLDYFYFTSVNSGGKIAPTINVDFDGDGLVDSKDRAILIKSLK